LLTTWAKGRKLMIDRMARPACRSSVHQVGRDQRRRVPGTAVFMTTR
jgi:KUP system potassium uptake protein